METGTSTGICAQTSVTTNLIFPPPEVYSSKGSGATCDMRRLDPWEKDISLHAASSKTGVCVLVLFKVYQTQKMIDHRIAGDRDIMVCLCMIASCLMSLDERV